MRRWQRDFDILDRLGSGTFGDVHRVLHKLDLQEYALKRVRLPDGYNSTNQKQLKEVYVLSTIHHRNIARYHGAWVEDVEPRWDAQFNFKSNDDDDDDITNSSSFARDLCTPGGAILMNGSAPMFPERCLFIQMELCRETLKDWINRRFEQERVQAETTAELIYPPFDEANDTRWDVFGQLCAVRL